MVKKVKQYINSNPSKNCPKCGTKMDVSLEEDVYLKDSKPDTKPTEYEYLMFHCSNCEELITEPLNYRTPFIFR